MTAQGEIVAEATSSKGMGKLERLDFEGALLELIEGWLHSDEPIVVMACGMVGARQGWIEVPYQQAPCKPLSPDLVGHPAARDARLNVIVLPGVKQVEPADVMRGEETQIAGVLLEQPEFDGVLCLPGTHTKWVRVKEGKIVEFKTFMTGELFDLLSAHSILRHNIRSENWDSAEFSTTTSAVVEDPASFAGWLFSIRAETLVSGLDANRAYARLTGVLIGAELAAAKRYWQDQNLRIVGNGMQAETYAEALRVIGNTPSMVQAVTVTIAGLRTAYEQIIGRRR